MSQRSPTRCPTPERIEQLLMGELEDEELRRHLQTCPICGPAAEEIRKDDELIKGFVEAGSGLRGALDEKSAVPSIEGYEILLELHRGGQGVIYKAVQKATKRMVALKVLRRGGYATARVRRRFEREIELNAKLQHPNIVTVYESGNTESGCRYFAMELIHGVPLDRHFKETLPAQFPDSRSRAREMLAKFATICEVVSYAHRRGVIHRDLKPDNILMDADGRPHILDFGVAKQLYRSSGDRATALTADGEFAGTFAYASPEQVSGAADDVDTLTDVYAVGVMMYESLTGRLPHPVEGSIADLIRGIADADPPPPSSIKREIDDEVEKILLKALNKDRQRRYQSADALREDITRYLTGEPIDAKRDSTWYVLTKTLRRHRTIVAVAAGFVILVTGFAIAMSVLAGKLAAQRDRAQVERRRADTTARIRTIEAGRQYAAAGDAARAEDLLWPVHLSASGQGAGGVVDGVEPGGALDSYWALWETYSRHPCLATWRAHEGRPLSSISFSPTGDMLATSGADDRTRLWSWPDRKNVRSFETASNISRPTCFSPDGALLAWANRNGCIRLQDIQKDGFRDINTHEERVDSIAFSPDGRTLASGGLYHGAIRQWDVQTWRPLPLIGKHDGGVSGLSFSPDGGRLASIGRLGSLMVWDAGAGELEWKSPGIRDVTGASICFAPNGATLATSVWDRFTIWDLAAQRARAGGTLSDNICALSFSPDGRWLALAGCDHSITLWDTDRKRVARALAGHRAAVVGLAVHPDDQVIASCSYDGSAKLWQFPLRGDFRRLKVQFDTVHCVQFSPDGRLLASSGGVRHDAETTRIPPIAVWGALSGELLAELPGHTDVVGAVAFHPGGRRLASASHDRTVRVWDLATSSELSSRVAHGGKISSVVYSADGRLLATGSDDLTVKLWDGTTLKLLHVFSGYSRRVAMVRFSPDGRLLASCSKNGNVYLHEVQSGTMHRLLQADPQGVRALCFSPDGRTLVSGDDGGAITLWDVSSGSRERSWVASSGDIFWLSFHPQGRILASAGREREIKLWDIATGRRLAALEGHENMVFSVCFHPDGRTLASGSADGSVGLWDLTYYDRHIAGNLEYQIERLPAEERNGATIEHVRRWASRVLARPWPRKLWKETAQRFGGTCAQE